jgi:hypothetical protein
LSEVFYTENGTLLLDMVHSPPPITIPGTREQLLNSYIVDPSGKIAVGGFPFEGKTMYHVHVMILTVDNIRNLFEPKVLVDLIEDTSTTKQLLDINRMVSKIDPASPDSKQIDELLEVLRRIQKVGFG